MGIACKKQSIQDWITQQWEIIFGSFRFADKPKMEILLTNPEL